MTEHSNDLWVSIPDRNRRHALEQAKSLRPPLIGDSAFRDKRAAPILDIAMKAAVAPTPENIRAARKLLNKETVEIRRRQRQAEEDRRHNEAEAERLRSLVGAMDAIINWAKAVPAVLERADSSAWPRFAKAIAREAIVAHDEHSPEQPSRDARERLLADGQPEVFLIQHDWASAFAGSTDFDGGEFRLPYDHCAFEFQISGRRVIALCRGNEGAICFDGDILWYIGEIGTLASLGELDEPDDEDNLRFVNRMVYSNIRALCIALDAEVAVTEVVRQPHVGHVSRSNTPRPSYRVVRLANRTRAAALPSRDDLPTRRVRLHFRRGHWRHYPDHKTWIRWQLVGNPDLGFIEKHYAA